MVKTALLALTLISPSVYAGCDFTIATIAGLGSDAQYDADRFALSQLKPLKAKYTKIEYDNNNGYGLGVLAAQLFSESGFSVFQKAANSPLALFSLFYTAGDYVTGQKAKTWKDSVVGNIVATAKENTSKSKRIIFVAHSQGSLFLNEALKQLDASKVGYVLVGTPSNLHSDHQVNRSDDAVVNLFNFNRIAGLSDLKNQLTDHEKAKHLFPDYYVLDKQMSQELTSIIQDEAKRICSKTN